MTLHQYNNDGNEDRECVSDFVDGLLLSRSLSPTDEEAETNAEIRDK